LARCDKLRKREFAVCRNNLDSCGIIGSWDLSVELAKSELTEAEARFVESICDGKSQSAALAAAGFSPDTSYARRLLKQPRILIAIEAEHRLRIATRGASAAFSRLYDTAEGVPSTGPMVDAAKFLANIAGYIAPKAAEPRPSGDVLAELNLDDLRAIIDRREAQAAQRAKPVDATVIESQDDKLLNLLD
jgi:hypothetical protein